MWFFLGMLIGAGLLLLVLWLREQGVRIAWYNWLLAVIGVVLVFFGLQNYFASSARYEPEAPGMFLLVFAVPGLVLLVVAALLVWWGFARKHRTAQPAS